jgi:hypothetical protein
MQADSPPVIYVTQPWRFLCPKTPNQGWPEFCSEKYYNLSRRLADIYPQRFSRKLSFATIYPPA